MYSNSLSSSSSLTPDQAAAVAGVTAFTGVIVFALYSLPLIVAMWKLFTKAGRAGWAAIIPFYNLWVMVEISRSESWKFWVILVATLLAWIPLLGFILSIVALVFEIQIIIKFAKQYDRSAGFWWLLWLLPIVGVFSVNKAQYIGAAPSADPSTPVTPPATPPTPPVSPAQPTPPAPPAA